MAKTDIPSQLAAWTKFVGKYRKDHPKDKKPLEHASKQYRAMKAAPKTPKKRSMMPKRKTPSRSRSMTPKRKTPSRSRSMTPKRKTPKGTKTPSKGKKTPSKKTPSRKTPSRKTPKSALKKSKGTPRKCQTFRPKRCMKFTK